MQLHLCCFLQLTCPAENGFPQKASPRMHRSWSWPSPIPMARSKTPPRPPRPPREAPQIRMGRAAWETAHLFRRPPANSKTPLRLCASARGSPVPDGEGSLNSHHHTPGIREIPYQNAPVLTKQVRIRHALGILRSKPTHNPGQ